MSDKIIPSGRQKRSDNHAQNPTDNMNQSQPKSKPNKPK